MLQGNTRWQGRGMRHICQLCAAIMGYRERLEGMGFGSLLNLQKSNIMFKLEVSFEHPSLVAPLSQQVDGIVGQTNILSDPPFHVDHDNAIY